MGEFDNFVDDFGGDGPAGGIEVGLPSGSTFQVLTDGEKEYVIAKGQEYLEHNRFQNISDLQDLDRILILELFVYRWSLWLSLERDYEGNEMLDPKINDNLIKANKEIVVLKKNCGIDKVSREKEAGESVAQYIANLRTRAKEFGVMRNEQAELAITLWRQTSALITLHDNCTDDERRSQNVTAQNIIDWLREQQPVFAEIDEKFRETSQKYWINDM